MNARQVTQVTLPDNGMLQVERCDGTVTFTRLLSEHVATFYIPNEPLTEDDRNMLEHPCDRFAHMFVAHVDRQPAGCVAVTRVGEIAKLWVRPTMRQRQVGTNLLHAAVQAGGTWATVHEQNVVAQHLFADRKFIRSPTNTRRYVRYALSCIVT